MNTQLLKLSDITTDAGTQIRARIDAETVDQYAAEWMGGAKFPAVTVFHDGNQYILADGFHRVMAASRNGFKDIEADVHKGTKSDALKFALAANSKHGLKRSNLDKRRSVELALAEWPKLSDRELAKICAVSNELVGDVRKTQLSDSDSSTRIGADGKERKLPTKKPAEPPTAPQASEPTSRPEPEQPAALKGIDVSKLDGAKVSEPTIELTPTASAVIEAAELTLNDLAFIIGELKSGTPLDCSQLKEIRAQANKTVRWLLNLEAEVCK